MGRIVQWIETEGLEGYLVFDGDNMSIEKVEPKEAKK